MPAKRDKFVGVRLSGEELVQLLSNANALGVSVSEYIRSLASLPVEVTERAVSPDEKERGDSIPVVIYHKDAYRKLEKQLRAWGYHYDQAVHALNTIASKRFMTQENTIALIEKANSLLADAEEYRKDTTEIVEGLPISTHHYSMRRAMPSSEDVATAGSREVS